MAQSINHVETTSEVAMSQNSKTILRGKMSNLSIKDYSAKISIWMSVKNIFLIPFIFVLLLLIIYPDYASELYSITLFALSIPLGICYHKIIFFYFKRRTYMKADEYRDARNAQLEEEFWDLNS